MVGVMPSPMRDPSDPEIRLALPTDAVAIAEFQTDCWREAYAGVVPAAYLDRVGVAEREIKWRDRILTGSRHVALAELRGSILGVVSWGTTPMDDTPPLELMSLYVAPAQRGTGLAARMLSCAAGVGPAHLWVFEANTRGQAFYQKHAFHPHGRRAIDPDTGLEELLYVRR